MLKVNESLSHLGVSPLVAGSTGSAPSHQLDLFSVQVIKREALLTLFSLSLPLSSSSTTSRELLSQFSTCSGCRGLDVVSKLKKIAMYC